MSRTYARTRIGNRGGGSTRIRLDRKHLGAICVDDTEIGFDLGYETEPLGNLCLCRVHTGIVNQDLPGDGELACGPGQVMSLGGPDRPLSGHVENARYLVVTFNPNLLDRVAAVGPGHRPQPVRLTGTQPTSPAAGRFIVGVVDYLRDILLAQPAPSPLVAATAGQYLAASVLNAFPNSALIDPTIEDRHDSTPALLRRALAYVDDNAHNDISVTDIADAIFVTPRAVQYMFRRHRNCTPMEYVRRVRLHHAHLELLEGDRTKCSVATVASRWGFAHTGRFAVQYRQVYGRSPHETLRG